jgi:hypothetical protein
MLAYRSYLGIPKHLIKVYTVPLREPLVRCYENIRSIGLRVVNRSIIRICIQTKFRGFVVFLGSTEECDKRKIESGA